MNYYIIFKHNYFEQNSLVNIKTDSYLLIIFYCQILLILNIFFVLYYII